MVNPMSNVPNFIKREIEKLEKLTKPVTQRAYKYIFWSYPLIFISLINLIILLFFIPTETIFNSGTVIFAIMGAIGFALSREAKVQRREIMKLSSDYMINRIKKSDIVSDHLKSEYINRVRQQPSRSMHHFVEFLQKENKLSYYN